MAYFDNAATTYPKPESVYQFMDKFYRASGASAGRGGYGLARNVGALIADTREKIQNLLHCQSKQVVFEPTATIALNIVIQGVIAKGAKNIYITPFEHNAVTRTLHHYEKQGITVRQLSVTKDLKYDLERIRYQFDEIKPDFVIMSHASNAFGLICSVADICLSAKKHGAVTLIDMAQTAGLVDLNVGLDTIDFAVFAGHKTLYGPTGISGFVMKPEIILPSVLFGGTGVDSSNQDMPDSLPARYEMGTINTSGIAGLNAALDWVQEKTTAELWRTEQEHRGRLLNILADYPFIRLVGCLPDVSYVGIVSCIMDGISSDAAGNVFSELSIAVRTGLQCAPLAHKFMGTYPAGTIRFSMSYFTSDRDFDELRGALDYIASEL